MGISRADLDAGRVDPIHPDLILREEWIAPPGLSVYGVARDHRRHDAAARAKLGTRLEAEVHPRAA